jgi:hypothetical protein
MEVQVTINPVGVQLSAARRRGLKAGGEAILALSDAIAPIEDVPRHGVHMIETGFVRPETDGDTDAAAIGYGAFWSIWQHERLDYHHTHGAAKFLEIALLEGQETALGIVAAAVSEALG